MFDENFQNTILWFNHEMTKWMRAMEKIWVDFTSRHEVLQKAVIWVLPILNLSISEYFNELNNNIQPVKELYKNPENTLNFEDIKILETKISNAENFNKIYSIQNNYSDNIINLWDEIKIDLISKKIFNPLNWKEIHISRLKKDFNVFITKLIQHLSEGIHNWDFWEDINEEHSKNNKDRIKNKLAKRDFITFIDDRMRNLKSLVYRRLEVKNKVKFIKSEYKVRSFCIR